MGKGLQFYPPYKDIPKVGDKFVVTEVTHSFDMHFGECIVALLEPVQEKQFKDFPTECDNYHLQPNGKDKK